MDTENVGNLYVHFPFCRRKCTYCALHSRAGSPPEVRSSYIGRLVRSVRALVGCRRRERGAFLPFSTVYFGGGTPALCNLAPLLDALAPAISANGAEKTEFTVELHPLDVDGGTLKMLRGGGVNRISMGVESLDDGVLRHMGRGYDLEKAERAFALVREHFDNAGIDLIAGYPRTGVSRDAADASAERLTRLEKWGLRHCSAYSLILEGKSILAMQLARQAGAAAEAGGGREESLRLPSDDEALDAIAGISRFLEGIGLRRYEISNYALPGYECRHNLAVWRGEDYIGLGEGACGRIGLVRTRNWWCDDGPGGSESFEVSPEEDEVERRIFSLRTREGISAAGRPEWTAVLEKFTGEKLLARRDGTDGAIYTLTARGMEVCDSILAELV